MPEKHTAKRPMKEGEKRKLLCTILEVTVRMKTSGQDSEGREKERRREGQR